MARAARVPGWVYARSARRRVPRYLARSARSGPPFGPWFARSSSFTVRVSPGVALDCGRPGRQRRHNPLGRSQPTTRDPQEPPGARRRLRSPPHHDDGVPRVRLATATWVFGDCRNRTLRAESAHGTSVCMALERPTETRPPPACVSPGWLCSAMALRTPGAVYGSGSVSVNRLRTPHSTSVREGRGPHASAGPREVLHLDRGACEPQLKHCRSGQPACTRGTMRTIRRPFTLLLAVRFAAVPLSTLASRRAR